MSVYISGKLSPGALTLAFVLVPSVMYNVNGHLMVVYGL